MSDETPEKAGKRKKRLREQAGAAVAGAGRGAKGGGKGRRKLRAAAKEEGTGKRAASLAPVNYLMDGVAGKHHDEIAGRGDELPNMIIIGAAKSGTTTLAEALRKHPDMFRGKRKEPRFFSREYNRGWEWYMGLFQEGKDKKIRYEASTLYTRGQRPHRHEPLLMKTYLPEVKLIYLCRHPMERIVSHWRHLKGRDEIAKHGEFNDFFEGQTSGNMVIGTSMYWERISEYRAQFPDEQILCLTMEDMIKDAPGTLRKILTFLGLPATQEAMDAVLVDGKFEQQNEAGAMGRTYFEKPEWKPEVYARVREMVEPDAKKFLAYMGKPEDFWKF